MKATDIVAITKSVTKKWTKQRKAEERSRRVRMNRQANMQRARVCQTDVAWAVIPSAYAKASDNGRLPAHARQIFYAARKEIQDHTGRPLDSSYFTQNLLPRYMNSHPETAQWWVVYDARGHLVEPHTARSVPLGTLNVDEYLQDIRSHKVKDGFIDRIDGEYPTCGPEERFSAVLFTEKEGFNPLFKATKLAERYDLAIMSTKGQSVVAARRLVDELCHRGADVPLLVLHDFDKEGFKIAETLTRVSDAAYCGERVRYEFQHEINVVDLGLRLSDIEQWKLESEGVQFKGDFDSDTITTAEERDFLKANKRVELNAFTSADFILWIESKLQEVGIEKIIPIVDTLEAAYRRAFGIALVNHRIDDIGRAAKVTADSVHVPQSLTEQIRDAQQNGSRAESWDSILARIAESDAERHVNEHA